MELTEKEARTLYEYIRRIKGLCKEAGAKLDSEIEIDLITALAKLFDIAFPAKKLFEWAEEDTKRIKETLEEWQKNRDHEKIWPMPVPTTPQPLPQPWNPYPVPYHDPWIAMYACPTVPYITYPVDDNETAIKDWY